MAADHVNITFPPEDDNFYADLRAEVDAYFKARGETHHGNRLMHLKVAVLVVGYLTAFGLILTASHPNMLWGCYAFLGFWGVFLGLNVGHDAVHYALFKNRAWNRWAMHVFDFLGLSSYNWKKRHVGGHHIFPNIMSYDPDIQQSKVVKIYPQDEHRAMYRFQWLYMPLIYAIFTLRWVFYRDFKDVMSERIGGVNNRPYPKREVVKMVIFKLSYVALMVVLPWQVTGMSLGTVALGFVILQFCASLTMTVVLLSSHIDEHSHFPEPDETGMMPHSWSKHHMLTTSDYATESFWVTHLFGGINHHVIHHLFQHVCHIHYPALTRILKEVAAKHRVPYRSTKYFFPAMYSHFRLLYKNGVPPPTAA